MQYFIGIVPPQKYTARIIQFQNRWSNNRLPQVVEPHITVKLRADYIRTWMGCSM